MNLQQATTFFEQYAREQQLPPQWLTARLAEVERIGKVQLTTEELTFGARLAWRNSNKCIGRLFWQSLHVVDARHLLDEKAIFDALLQHIRSATNGGKIRPMITIFHESRVRIYNHQLVRYAGYETAEGIIGDPHSLKFTAWCETLGWRGAKTDYDILPLVVSIDDRPPVFYHIPKEDVLQVPITHPDFPLIDDLQLQWYAVPMIADMKCRIAGIDFCAAPFNGWYMGTEIGARNLADEQRYNKLRDVARAIGIKPSRNMTLWKDRALVELNFAVLHSFKQHGVSIVDHHTAAQQFVLFQQQEKQAGRSVTGNWAWLIPPLSPATTPIFHERIDNTIVEPNYFYTRKMF